MENNSDSRRKDPAWKHAIEVEVEGEGAKKGYKYLSCKYCSKVIKGGVKRVKEHLACTSKNVAKCSKVPESVKNEIKAYLEEWTNTQCLNTMKFEEMVGSGSYYSSSAGGGTSNAVETHALSDRGVRGPMDRYLGNENDDGGEVKMTPAAAKEHRNQVCLDIGRFFFENGLPFNIATSPSFPNMLRSVANYGRGLKPPSMHELRSWILDKEEETTSQIVDDIKSTWKKTGVSLLSDGWTDMRNRSLINFLVNNPHGTVFLKTVDASDCVKNAEKLFELLDGIVEEIGEDIVVQVITDNAAAYKSVGAMLMKKRTSLYWTPCAAHCIDLMLEMIGELPQHKSALQKAKRVSNFIYNHQYVLAQFRKITKKDLIRPAATRFATATLTLESMLELKQALQTMFVSREWSSCAWAKKPEGKEVKKIVIDDRNFWPGVVYCIKTTQPLVEVLRIVDGERSPALGFIYGAIDEVPELKAFTMKILGLTCSASACERNWSTFNQVHTKRRNRLTTKKLNSLVYIMYNKKLKDKHLKKQSRKDDVDPLIVEDVPSDDEWIVDPNDEDEVLHIEYVDEGGCSSASRKRKGTHSTQTPTSKGKETTSRFAMIDEDAEHESGGEDVGSDGNGDGYESFLNF